MRFIVQMLYFLRSNKIVYCYKMYTLESQLSELSIVCVHSIRKISEIFNISHVIKVDGSSFGFMLGWICTLSDDRMFLKCTN